MTWRPDKAYRDYARISWAALGSRPFRWPHILAAIAFVLFLIIVTFGPFWEHR